MNMVMLQYRYLEHCDSYIELIEDDSALFRNPTAFVPSPQTPAMASEWFWYMDRNPKRDSDFDVGNVPHSAGVAPAVNWAALIDRLLDSDSR